MQGLKCENCPGLLYLYSYRYIGLLVYGALVWWLYDYLQPGTKTWRLPFCGAVRVRQGPNSKIRTWVFPPTFCCTSTVCRISIYLITMQIIVEAPMDTAKAFNSNKRARPLYKQTVCAGVLCACCEERGTAF